MPTDSIGSDIVKKYLTEFPSAKSKTLAVKIYRENPTIFSSIEHARSVIRYYRGSMGEENRGKLIDTAFLKEPDQAGDPFIKLPQGIESLNWNPFKIEGDNRVLKLADLQIPYHDKRAIETAVERGKEFNPTIILLNGDISDVYSLSTWEKDPRERDYPYELEVTILFLAYIREQFPKARIIWKLGNHEERYERHMILRAPDLLSIPQFDFPKAYECAKHSVEIVRDMRPIKLNKLAIIHGHEYKFAITNPVNPARGLFLKAKANACCDHFHQSSNHSDKDINEKIISCWSSGCLCLLHPKYRPLNNWNHGFSIIETSGSEKFLFHNFKLIDYEVYYV